MFWPNCKGMVTLMKQGPSWIVNSVAIYKAVHTALFWSMW